MVDPYALNIYTDGSSYPGPRRGGMDILYVWVDSSGVEHLESLDQPGVVQATNNLMELLAPIRALQEVGPLLEKRHFSRVLIHSDSQYVVKNIQNAIYFWSRNRWCNRAGKPVDNAFEWRLLLKEMQKLRMRVDFELVKGHKDPYNKVVDKQAKSAATSATGRPISVEIVRRKLSSETTDTTSVPMKGQRLTIRIISSKYMSLHQTNKYRFEVMTKRSVHFGKGSFLYSKELMKPGHWYYVQLNKSDKRIYSPLRRGGPRIRPACLHQPGCLGSRTPMGSAIVRQ
jgi:ribonuclease HI